MYVHANTEKSDNRWLLLLHGIMEMCTAESSKYLPNLTFCIFLQAKACQIATVTARYHTKLHSAGRIFAAVYIHTQFSNSIFFSKGCSELMMGTLAQLLLESTNDNELAVFDVLTFSYAATVVCRFVGFGCRILVQCFNFFSKKKFNIIIPLQIKWLMECLLKSDNVFY